MKTFLLVKGKPRKMVGDPTRAGRWAGQQLRPLKDGEDAPSKRRDRFEPCWTAHDYSGEARSHLSKALAKEEIAALVRVQAEDMADALKKAPADKQPAKVADKPKAKKGDS